MVNKDGMKNKNQAASELGKLGGRASVNSRFKGMTKEQISEYMKKVRRKGMTDKAFKKKSS